MKLQRRIFLAGLGGAGLGVGLGRFSHFFPLPSPAIGPDWKPGDEERVPSTCLLCPSHCGIVGRVVDGSLVGIDGNPLHPLNRGGLCPKGKAGIQMLYHPSRLREALERVGPPGSSDFRPIEWEAALDRVSTALSGLREAGRARSVAYLGGDIGGTLEALIQRFLQAYGTPHLIREDYADGSAEVLEMSQGRAIRPAFDLDRASLVLSFGAPLAEAWWSLPHAARARETDGSRRRWIQADTRLSRTAAASDEWLPLKPGTYGVLALGIAYILLKEGLYDREWISRGVTGFDDRTDEAGRPVPGFQTLVQRHGRPETVADRTGLPVETIVRIAKEFGRSPRPLAVWDQAVSWRRGGLGDALVIHALNILSGSLQRPGGVYFEASQQLPSLGEIGSANRDPVRPSGDALRASGWAEHVLSGVEPSLEILFLHQSNPVASAPDPDTARRALDKIPLVVSFSPFLDESARHADLVLPDHTYLERWQDGFSPASVPYPVWGLVQPVVPPLHDTRASGDVLLDLASRIGGEVAEACPWADMESLVQQRAKRLASVHRGSVFVADFRRSELRELAARGWWIPHGQSPTGFWESLRKTGGWFDPYHDDAGRSAASDSPGGLVALFPPEARRRLSEIDGSGLLAIGTDASEEKRTEAGGYPLRLIPYRVMTLSSGSTALMPWLLENIGVLTGASWEVWVEINPHTAHELGLQDRERVSVVSEHGRFDGRLLLFAGAQPGVVNVPYGLHSRVEGWGSLQPANPLRAVGPRQDPATGLPDWYSTRVRIESV